jgi:predicted  nucleic acid-binding Zn-ribbon protein
MSMESFKILKEINSLSIRRNELLDLTAGEQKRIVFIENNRAQREETLLSLESQLKQYKTDLTQVENQINLLSLKIEKDKKNLTSLIDESSIESLSKQIDEMRNKLDNNEEQGLELLEKIEGTVQEIKDCHDFLEGSLESLNEIKEEVDESVSQYQKEVDSINKRDKLLMEELPPNFKSKIELILKKNIQLSSFSRIKGECCEFCRFKLSKVDIIAIEDKLTLKSCQGCSRIFIPIQSGY